MASRYEFEIKSGIQFQVRYRIDGQQKTKTFTSKGKTATAIKRAERDANRFLKEIEAEIALGIAKDESDMTFYDCVWHVYNMKFEKLEKTTINNYTIYINQVCNFFGNRKLKTITPMVIEKYLNTMSKEKSKRILKFYWSILNTTFDYAFKKDLVTDNPMLKVEFIASEKVKEKKKIMPINEKDVEVLLSLLSEVPKYHYLTKLMLHTGMRVGEAQAITWRDVDYNKKIISINKNYKRTNEVGNTKTKRIRAVPLHQPLKELLEEIKQFQKEHKKMFGADYEDNNLIVPNEDGSYMKYEAIKSYFQRLDKKMQTKVRSHRFRHTFASTLILKQGLNPKIVQKLLGHQKFSTTMDIYTDLFDDEYDEETYDSLGSAFSNESSNHTTKIQQENQKVVN